MSSLLTHIERLRRLFAEAAAASARFQSFVANNPAGRQDEVGSLYEKQLLEWESAIVDYLDRKLLRYPPAHGRHSDKLDEFHRVAGYEASVFIMTKFPDPKASTALDKELQAVIDATTRSVAACGFVPRLAKRTYHEWLWDNVELHLLGCARGIAIVEDRYRPELNPNVALEWGWMKGMGKPVLYLMEKRFQSIRADWHGLIASSFSWSTPESDIDAAVRAFLQPGP